MPIILLVLGLILSHPPLAHAESGQTPSFVHHDIKVTLYPDSHRFTAEDTITLPDQPDKQSLGK